MLEISSNRKEKRPAFQKTLHRIISTRQAFIAQWIVTKMYDALFYKESSQFIYPPVCHKLCEYWCFIYSTWIIHELFSDKITWSQSLDTYLLLRSHHAEHCIDEYTLLTNYTACRLDSYSSSVKRRCFPFGVGKPLRRRISGVGGPASEAIVQRLLW